MAFLTVMEQHIVANSINGGGHQAASEPVPQLKSTTGDGYMQHRESGQTMTSHDVIRSEGTTSEPVLQVKIREAGLYVAQKVWTMMSYDVIKPG